MAGKKLISDLSHASLPLGLLGCGWTVQIVVWCLGLLTWNLIDTETIPAEQTCLILRNSSRIEILGANPVLRDIRMILTTHE